MTTLIESYEQQYSNLSAEITVTVGKIGNSIGGIGFQSLRYFSSNTSVNYLYTFPDCDIIRIELEKKLLGFNRWKTVSQYFWNSQYLLIFVINEPVSKKVVGKIDILTSLKPWI